MFIIFNLCLAICSLQVLCKSAQAPFCELFKQAHVLEGPGSCFEYCFWQSVCAYTHNTSKGCQQNAMAGYAHSVGNSFWNNCVNIKGCGFFNALEILHINYLNDDLNQHLFGSYMQSFCCTVYCCTNSGLLNTWFACPFNTHSISHRLSMLVLQCPESPSCRILGSSPQKWEIPGWKSCWTAIQDWEVE